jgi:hypothetical protein
MGMITKQQYVEYLLATPVNYTCSNLADHLDDVSHDAVSDYLPGTCCYAIAIRAVSLLRVRREMSRCTLLMPYA